MPSLDQPSIRIIPAAELHAKPIRIGTTTELAIFPPDSNFESRDFLCRVSTATLTEGGPFTKFDGYMRILALVVGKGMDLNVDGVSHSICQPFQMLRFMGDVPTTSVLLGESVSDFNVIFRPNVEANLEQVALGPGFSALPRQARAGGDGASIRVDVLWSPDSDSEISIGRRTLSLGERSVLVVQHGISDPPIEARSPKGTGNLLFVRLRMPS